MDYITTVSGIRFVPTNPRPEDVRIEDIAHALSHLCRANGHFPTFFSVAQHSINCALEAAARDYPLSAQLACLLHDASEAYISDITRPVKCHLPQYLTYEAALQKLLYETLMPCPVSQQDLDIVSEMDDTQLYYEFLNISGYEIFPQAPMLVAQPRYDCTDFPAVRETFLSLYHQLYNHEQV